MISNGDMASGRPEEQPLGELLGEVLDLIDETTAQISDDTVEERLRKVVSQPGPASKTRASVTAKSEPETREPPKRPRSHWDMLMESRSVEDLEAVLAERLEIIKERRRRDGSARDSGVA